MLAMFGALTQPQGQQTIPDAPRPQVSLPTTVTPGQGTTSSSGTDAAQNGAGVPSGAAPAAGGTASAPPAGAPGAGAPPATGDQTPTYEPTQGQGADAVYKLRGQGVDEVDIPFTVKDSKGRLVPGLKARDIQVYENNVLQHIDIFTDDPLPLSVALVVDQSMTPDQMDKVNTALGALQDAFTKYDEVAVYTYNKHVNEMTTFTSAASARLTQAIEGSKGGGREAMMAGSLSGPLSQNTNINNQSFDPNTRPDRGGVGPGIQLSPEREIHPLNDAILEAATALSTRPIKTRRVIYVISNGNEYGSTAKTSEVEKYLLTNGIELDGTLVGDNAMWGLGTLDKMHLPLMMRDNVLIAYQKATGGQIDSEFREKAIEQSFARVAGEARNRYTVVYRTHEPFVDGKYRKVEIKVLYPNLTVLARGGYWPSAMEIQQRPAVAPTK
jgi:VWFA-related protein